MQTTTATPLNRSVETRDELLARMRNVHELMHDVEYGGVVSTTWERANAAFVAGDLTRAARLTTLTWRAVQRRRYATNLTD